MDTDVDVTRLTPPLENLPRELLSEMAKQMFVPLDVAGSRQHILSLRHGEIRDKKRLFALLSGSEVETLPPPPPAVEKVTDDSYDAS